MRPLRYSINVTLDGCCDHRVGIPDAELHERALDNIRNADAMLLGRATYQLMEQAWRPPANAQMPAWTQPFAQTIDAAKKYVVSSTLESVDWNAELLKGDLRTAVEALKAQPGNGLTLGGVTLPITLANMGLIDEYEFVVHPLVAGHGPRLLDGLHERLDLRLVSRLEYRSGVTALRYVPVA
jgi:dihydrofolate reductase